MSNISVLLERFTMPLIQDEDYLSNQNSNISPNISIDGSSAECIKDSEPIKDSTYFIPIGVKGLEELLSTSSNKNRGFERPRVNNVDKVVPRVVLIKGIPGCGKSLLSIKMMLTMIRHNCQIHYICLNDSCETVYSQSKNFNFCSAKDFKNYLDNYMLNLYDTRPKKKAHAGDADPEIEKKQNKDSETENISGQKSHINYSIKSIEKNIDSFDSSETTKVVFIDSINVSDLTNDSDIVRSFINKLKFENNGRSRNQLTFILLEDYASKYENSTNSLIAKWEFLADIVIELGEELREGYQNHYIKINKKHYGHQIYGKHLLKITPVTNPFSNVESETGVVIFPSVHKYLSGSLQDTFSRSNFVHTGISHLDSILAPSGSKSVFNGKSIPQNACFVIQSQNESYHLALGLNILWGGLWKITEHIENDEQNYRVESDKDVLLISLAEENNIEIFNTAIAHRTDLFTAKNLVMNLDNGHWIEWRYHNAQLAKDAFNNLLTRYRNNPILKSQRDKKITSSNEIWNELLRNDFINEKGVVNNEKIDKVDLFEDGNINEQIKMILKKTYHGDLHYLHPENDNYQTKTRPNFHCTSRFIDLGQNESQKVLFNKWCAYILDNDGNRIKKCRKMVIASFRPGCITPEQFIYSISKILDGGNFSRILFNSTAHLGMRYPLLKSDSLFIPSLIDLFKSKNVVSIFIDPKSEGSDKLLSYTLENVADYLILLKELDIDYENYSNIPHYETIKNINGKKESIDKVLKENVDECKWTELIVENFRGNNYSRSAHAVTARYVNVEKHFNFDAFSDYLKESDPSLFEEYKLEFRLEEIWSCLHELRFIEDGKDKSEQVISVNIATNITEILKEKLSDEKEYNDHIRELIIKTLHHFKNKSYNELFITNIRKHKRREQEQRYSALNKIHLKIGEDSFEIVNISENGAQVVSKKDKLEINGIETEISFVLNDNNKPIIDNPIKCKPIIKWAKCSPSKKNAFLMGLQFTEHNVSDMKKFINRLRRSDRRSARLPVQEFAFPN